MDGTKSFPLPPASIKDATNRCLEGFESILNTASGASLSKVEDNLTRFRIWAGNIGAYHGLPSRASADSRLREAPEVKNRVLELLHELLETNGELSAFLNTDEGDNEPSEDDDFDPIEDLCLSASDSITSLLKVSTLLRKATSRDRYAQALASKHDTLPPEYSAFDQRHVAEKFPKVQKQQWLCDRLAHAITMRRRFLRYAQSHQKRIAREPTEAPANQPMHLRAQLAPSHTQKSGSAPNTMTETVQSTAASTLQPQKLAEMNLDSLDIDEDDNISQATSFISEAGPNDEYRSEVIALDKLAKHREPFECRYCHGMVQFRNQRAWKKHVFRDLRAYVCTFETCDVGFFEDRNAWFAHELECHRRLLVCLACSNKVFHSVSSFEAHLQTVHTHQYPTGLKSLLNANSRPVTEIPLNACPMCDDWSPNAMIDTTERDTTTVSPSLFKQHLGNHQEQLALFSITPSLERQVDSDGGSQGSGISIHRRLNALLEWQDNVDMDADGDNQTHIPPQNRSEPAEEGEEFFVRDAGILPESSEGQRKGWLSDATVLAGQHDNKQFDLDPHDKLLYGDTGDLLFAAATGDELTVEALLEIGTDVDIPWKNPRGHLRPRCEACPASSRYESPSDALWTCKQCRSYYLCHECKLRGKTCKNDSEHTVGAYLNARHGATALSLAGTHQHWNVVRKLLEHGANIHAGMFSKTLMHTAIVHNEFEVAKFLVENGVDVDALDPVTKQRPLDIAVVKGSIDLVDLLLGHGADINAQGGEPDHTPLWRAINEGHAIIANRLLERGAKADSTEVANRLKFAKTSSREWEDTVKLFTKAYTRDRLRPFSEMLTEALGESKAVLPELESVHGSDRALDTSFSDLKRVIWRLGELVCRPWTLEIESDKTIKIIDDIELTIEPYRASIRSLWDAKMPAKGEARRIQVVDGELLKFIDQTRRTRSTLDRVMSDLESPRNRHVNARDASDFETRDQEADHYIAGFQGEADDADAQMGDQINETEQRSTLSNDAPATAQIQLQRYAEDCSEDDETQKQMLLRAIEQANDAIEYDSGKHLASAHEAYTNACTLLQAAMVEMLKSRYTPDMNSIESIYATYTKRIDELNELIKSREDEAYDDPAVYRCICGDNNPLTARTFIGCDQCGVFQHCVCMGVPRGDIPERYLCERCAPDDHDETLMALERGVRIWESRINLLGGIIHRRPSQQDTPKGILRKPTERFPEHPSSTREGVARLNTATKSGIPPGARWTKIDRSLVNPGALEEAKERFEERPDCVIVLRPLTKEEIQKLADRTSEIRKMGEQEGMVESELERRKVNILEEYTRTAYGFTCDECTSEFSRASDLQHHTDTVHAKPNIVYVCLDCTYFTSRKDQIMEHRNATAHYYGGARTHQQGIAVSVDVAQDQSTEKQFTVSIHTQQAGEDLLMTPPSPPYYCCYPCDSNLMRFEQKDDLKRHVLDVHVRHKYEVECEYGHCLRTFSGRNAMHEHMRKVHKSEPSHPLDPQSEYLHEEDTEDDDDDYNANFDIDNEDDVPLAYHDKEIYGHKEVENPNITQPKSDEDDGAQLERGKVPESRANPGIADRVDIPEGLAKVAEWSQDERPSAVSQVSVQQIRKDMLTTSLAAHFYCFYEPCAGEGKAFERKADLERHIVAIHARAAGPILDCGHPGCHRRGEYGFARRDKMVEHMRDVHKSDVPRRQSDKRSQ